MNKIHTIISFSLIMCYSIFADKKESVNGEDLIKAFRLYREASANITKIHNEIYSNISYLGNGDIASPQFTPNQKKLYIKTEKLLKESSILNPYNPEVYMYLGIYNMEFKEDFKKAFKYFSDALEIDPHYEAILSFRFDMSLKINRLDIAEEDLETLKSIESSYYDSCASEYNDTIKSTKDNKAVEANLDTASGAEV